MHFFNFFGRKTQHNAAAENIAGIYGHLAEINGHFEEISRRLYKIETKQKETSLQLEDIDDFIQNGGRETALIDTLISLADTIYDFYYYAGTDEDSPLSEQARMMWNSAKTAAESAGLEIIDAGSEPFDFNFHSAENTEQDCYLPNGYVIKTLKCGYIYKDEVVRRASVIVNKIDNDDKTEKTDSSNIIYL